MATRPVSRGQAVELLADDRSQAARCGQTARTETDSKQIAAQLDPLPRHFEAEVERAGQLVHGLALITLGELRPECLGGGAARPVTYVAGERSHGGQP